MTISVINQKRMRAHEQFHMESFSSNLFNYQILASKLNLNVGHGQACIMLWYVCMYGNLWVSESKKKIWAVRDSKENNGNWHEANASKNEPSKFHLDAVWFICRKNLQFPKRFDTVIIGTIMIDDWSGGRRDSSTLTSEMIASNLLSISWVIQLSRQIALASFQHQLTRLGFWFLFSHLNKEKEKK